MHPKRLLDARQRRGAAVKEKRYAATDVVVPARRGAAVSPEAARRPRGGAPAVVAGRRVARPDAMRQPRNAVVLAAPHDAAGRRDLFCAAPQQVRERRRRSPRRRGHDLVIQRHLI